MVTSVHVHHATERFASVAEVFVGLGLADDAVTAYRYALDNAGVGVSGESVVEAADVGLIPRRNRR